jgi:hypothetical protein
MTPNDRKQIELWLADRQGKIDLELISDASPMSAALGQFCDALADISPDVKIKKRSPDSDAEQPAILVDRRLKYQAAPLGPELGPFLDALARQMNPPEKADGTDALDALTIPAHLQVYIAPQCPHCPDTVAQLLPLVHANDNVIISIIDGTLFTDMADKDQIKAVPTVILDTDFRWTGPVDMVELTETIVNRDPVKLGPQTLRSFIDDGRASDLAQMMISAQAVFPALIELITHDLWSIRLGAMVAAEEIAWDDRPLAGTMIPALAKRFTEVNETVQGDILHVIGESGGTDHIPFLESIAVDATNEELQEAARDAIESIQEYLENPDPTT